jgi:hypothetical protein
MAFSLCLNAQEVKNVEAKRIGDKIVIKYEITDENPKQRYDVSLYVSRNGGKSFEGPLKNVIGHVGEGITPGQHQIVWDVYKDVNALQGDIVFDVKARLMQGNTKKEQASNKTEEPSSKKEISQKTKKAKASTISYFGSLDAPVGIALGNIGGIGWYVSMKTDMNFNKPKHTYGGDSWYPDLNGPKYYEFNNTKKIRRTSITGGATWQLGKDFFVYTGAGYGIKELLWQINIYDYSTNLKKGEEYVKQPDYSYSGLEAEAGFILRMNSFLLEAGATTVNFNYMNFTLGVGLAF